MEKYSFEKYLQTKVNTPLYDEFYDVCAKVKDMFFSDWEKRENSKASLEIQKRAIIGYQKEKDFYKSKILELVKELNSEDIMYPLWYSDLIDAIYQENWGMAGLSEWFTDAYSNSSSAKVIGNRIYFMENGTMNLKPQVISSQRLDQLIKAFLLLTPEERMDKSYYETYLLDGTRVTVFMPPIAKKGQPSIVLRRYIIPQLTFEEQAKRGTIAKDMIPMLKSMVKIGYNVVFMGAVRTAKTTFLSTWQALENPKLEGVMVETDPEIPMDKILPNAPILQLLADGDDLKKITKNLLRSDADYFILAEARDGIALDTAVRIAQKGTKRMKLTFHSRNPLSFPEEAASEIVKTVGGDMQLTMQAVARSFDFIFHFVQLADRSKKRLEGIYQMSINDYGSISVEQICKFNRDTGKWCFFGTLASDKVVYAMESDVKEYFKFKKEFEKLCQKSQS